MVTKKPAKAFIVSQTKRANTRLKVIGETCLNLALRCVWADQAMGAKADFLLRAIKLFREFGIDVELGGESNIQIGIRQTAIAAAVEALQDETKRRSDRGVALKRTTGNDVRQ